MADLSSLSGLGRMGKQTRTKMKFWSVMKNLPGRTSFEGKEKGEEHTGTTDIYGR